ncbi:hypothetical protein [Photobacterium sp. J15]|uniref:hypothetical protein n=1 Tax=Photobacterium sp. J15 TaxID=265901 RepID=UPI0007E3EDEA|nr:hypothetical protein [Photobacterium sp. J15]
MGRKLQYIKSGVSDAFSTIKRDTKDFFFGNTRHNAFGIQNNALAESRYATLCILANTEIKRELSFDTGLMGNYVGSLEPLNDLKDGCAFLLNQTMGGQKIVNAVSYVGESLSAIMEKIKALIAGFFSETLQKIQEHYECFKTVECIAGMGTWLASEFADNLTNCIPGLDYYQNAGDMYEGMKTAVLKAKDFVNQMYKGIGVDLLNGHPTIIASALARHSLTSAAGGVAKAGVAATKIGLASAANVAGGWGFLVSMISGLLERIIKLVDTIVQSQQLKKVFGDAKEIWNSYRVSGHDVIGNHDDFAKWFQGAVITTPIVAAIVMGSGCVNHPNSFLQLVNSHNMILEQGKFNKGVAYITELQKQSGKYFREYSENYGVVISSPDGFIESQFKSLREGTRKY